MKVKEQKKLFQQAKEIEIKKSNECLMVLATIDHVPAFHLRGEGMEVTHSLFCACVECEGLIDVLRRVVDAYDNSGLAEKLKSELDKIQKAN
jgi:hypothetical protein